MQQARRTRSAARLLLLFRHCGPGKTAVFAGRPSCKKILQMRLNSLRKHVAEPGHNMKRTYAALRAHHCTKALSARQTVRIVRTGKNRHRNRFCRFWVGAAFLPAQTREPRSDKRRPVQAHPFEKRAQYDVASRRKPSGKDALKPQLVCPGNCTHQCFISCSVRLPAVNACSPCVSRHPQHAAACRSVC